MGWNWTFDILEGKADMWIWGANCWRSVDETGFDWGCKAENRNGYKENT